MKIKLNKEKVALSAILVNIILALFKTLTGLINKSPSILASGIDSATDVISSLISFVGIKISKKPADKEHPYGHHKIEVIMGFGIILILLIASGFIIYEGIKELQHPTPKAYDLIPIGVMILSAIINEVMARTKIYYGKKEHSPTLILDGTHSRIDVITSIAVLIGLLLSPYFIYAEPILTIIIGLFILKNALELGKENLDSLIDSTAGKETENKIIQVITQNKINLVELKTQKKGSITSASIKIELPKKLRIEKADKITNKLKKELTAQINSLEYIEIRIQGENKTKTRLKPKIISKIINKKREWGYRNKKTKKYTGKCICEKCGYTKNHSRGTPCIKEKCPKCKTNLVRKTKQTKQLNSQKKIIKKKKKNKKTLKKKLKQLKKIKTK